MMVAGCPRCGLGVPLHEGRPAVTAVGIDVWHQRCWDRRDQPIARAAAPVSEIRAERPPVFVPSARRSWRNRVALGGVVAGVAVAITAMWTRVDAAPAALANVELRSSEGVEPGVAITHADDAPPAVKTLEELHPLPMRDGEPIDRVFGSLAGWVHPVTDSPELLPTLGSRLFGATRAGILRDECGHGHCGVDLDGPRGRPIVAVAAGEVVRVERQELGADGRSGRYVRLRHDDGTLTAYMHLDAVEAGLQVGDRVRGGQYLGTLGATAVYAAPPHLHFSLEVPHDPAARGDHTATRYLDPAPFLVRATIAPSPERRRPIKPGS